MEKLPKGFPEYSIMYKTLSKKIKHLELQRETTNESEMEEMELKIQEYRLEIKKIKKMFPEGFFEDEY